MCKVKVKLWSGVKEQRNKEFRFCNGDVYFVLRNFFYYLRFISMHIVLNKLLDYICFYIPRFFFLFLKSPKACSASLSYQPHSIFFFEFLPGFPKNCFSLATCFVYQRVNLKEMDSRGEWYVEIRVSISPMVTNSWRVLGINM